MQIKLSDLLDRKSATLLMKPHMLLQILRESNEIGRKQGSVYDMLIFMDEEGDFKYTLLPKNPGQN